MNEPWRDWKVGSEHITITTPEGYVTVFKHRRMWRAVVWQYLDDLGRSSEPLTFVDCPHEDDARLCAQTLAHHHICPDCQREPVAEH